MNPIHTHNTKYYEILRPCLWFAVGEKIPTEIFTKYYTNIAVKSLLDFEFIKMVIK